MQPELAPDVADAAFINQWVTLHDHLRLSGDHICLVSKGEMGIRYDGRQKEGMCMTTLAADHPANVKFTGRTVFADRAVIIAVYR